MRLRLIERWRGAATSAPGSTVSPDAETASLAQADTDDHDVLPAEEERRAHALRLVLGIEVVIDRTGWVRDDPQVLIHRDRDGQIYPQTVRISHDTPDAKIVGERPLNVRFTDYNRLIQALHSLAERAAAEVARTTASPDSPIVFAHRELSVLGQFVGKRQAEAMGNNVVSLSALDREIDVLRRLEIELEPIVAESEAAGVAPTWLGAPIRFALMFSRLIRRRDDAW